MTYSWHLSHCNKPHSCLCSRSILKQFTINYHLLRSTVHSSVFFPPTVQKKNWKGWAALEIFGSILFTGIHAFFFFFFFLAIRSSTKGRICTGQTGHSLGGGSLATRRGASGRKREQSGSRGEREDPTVTNDYEHLLISLAFIIVQRKPGLVCTPTVLWGTGGWLRAEPVSGRLIGINMRL